MLSFVVKHRKLILISLFVKVFFLVAFVATASASITQLNMEVNATGTVTSADVIADEGGVISHVNLTSVKDYDLAVPSVGCYPNSGGATGASYSPLAINYFNIGLGASTTGYLDCTQAGYYRTVASESVTGEKYYYEFYYDGASTTYSVGVGPANCTTDPSTRVSNFTPADNSTTTGPTVDFSLEGCVSADDLGTIKGVSLSFENIDQNVLLLGDFSPNQFYLLRNYEVTEAGQFSFATSGIPLADGNYRIEACIERSYFFSFLTNPFSSISDCQSHQFVVGEGTFIGNISQNLYQDTNDFFNGLSATSTEALASSCNPISGNFNISTCLAYLLIPDAQSLGVTMENAKLGILSRVPWGYLTRFVTIITSNATSSIPSFTVPIQVGAGNTETPEITTITIDPSDMIAGGGALLDSIHDPINGKSVRDVFKPMVQLTIALMVLLVIIMDLIGMSKDANQEESRKGTNLS